MREELPEMTLADEIDIAYFSMEIAADPDWLTYAGGLGVLAGDLLRSAADRGLDPQLGNAQDRERARPPIAKTPVANPA
jgi:glucan phosphorylase